MHIYGADNAVSALNLIYKCIGLREAHQEALSEVLNEVSDDDCQDIYDCLVSQFPMTYNGSLKETIMSIPAFTSLSSQNNQEGWWQAKKADGTIGSVYCYTISVVTILHYTDKSSCTIKLSQTRFLPV